MNRLYFELSSCAINILGEGVAWMNQAKHLHTISTQVRAEPVVNTGKRYNMRNSLQGVSSSL